MKYKYKYKLHNDTNIRIQKCQHCNTSQEINFSEFCGFLEFQPLLKSIIVIQHSADPVNRERGTYHILACWRRTRTKSLSHRSRPRARPVLKIRPAGTLFTILYVPRETRLGSLRSPRLVRQVNLPRDV